MKFCAYCGNELKDQASICVKCGCTVKDVEVVTTLKKEEVTRINENIKPNYKKRENLAVVFDFVWGVLICISAFMLIIAIINAGVYLDSEVYEVYGIYYLTDYSRLLLSEDCLIVGAIFSHISAPFAVMSYIFSLKNGATLQKKFSGILKFTITILLIFVMCVFSNS